jgi:hypothetical protein
MSQTLKSNPRKPPTTFLFLLIFNCQITDASKPQGPNRQNFSNSTTFRDQTETRSQPACANQSVISSEQKPSSPAAPPPSFSERVIKPTLIASQQPCFGILEKNSNALIKKDNFDKIARRAFFRRLSDARGLYKQCPFGPCPKTAPTNSQSHGYHALYRESKARPGQCTRLQGDRFDSLR